MRLINTTIYKGIKIEEKQGQFGTKFYAYMKDGRKRFGTIEATKHWINLKK